MESGITPSVTVIGGGFAGVEAAWAAAEHGVRVDLFEMRPERQTSVHQTGDLAELVCSNSFKSNLLTNASGVLKEEMRRLGSLVLPIAATCSVPAGEALAVDRVRFARDVTEAVESHPLITIHRREVTELPTARPLVIATGPLTTESLATQLQTLTGAESLYFYDAVAPTVTLESLDLSLVFRASRHGKGADGSGGTKGTRGTPETEPANDDYLNCPMNHEEYMAFWTELVGAEAADPHNPDDKTAAYFEMCLPIEEMARRGPRTLAYGPMKPIGLTDPRTGRWPYAVVQLRQDNREGTLWGMVGFQSRLKWPEQRRIFRMIPGLASAEFVRLGVMHKNLYVCSPRVLNATAELREHPGLFLAGQITGVEGYLESAAIGILAGINAARTALGKPTLTPPRETVLGSLCAYLVETEPKRFAPMNSNFGIVPELETPVRDKREKARLKGVRALEGIDGFVSEVARGG